MNEGVYSSYVITVCSLKKQYHMKRKNYEEDKVIATFLFARGLGQ